MSETLLVRAERLLDLVAATSERDILMFSDPEGEAADDPVTTLLLVRSDWEHMGKPFHVTVTIKPGDTLNQ